MNLAIGGYKQGKNFEFCPDCCDIPLSAILASKKVILNSCRLQKLK
jgi:hypothetical protein